MQTKCVLVSIALLLSCASCAVHPVSPEKTSTTVVLASERETKSSLSTIQTIPEAAAEVLNTFLQDRKSQGARVGNLTQKYERFELVKVLYQDDIRIILLLKDESKGQLTEMEMPRKLLMLEKQNDMWLISDETDWMDRDSGWAAVESYAAALFAEYRTLPVRSEVDRAIELLNDFNILSQCFPPAGSQPEMWEELFATYPNQLEIVFDETQSANFVSSVFFHTFSVEQMDFASPTFVISLRKNCDIDLERFPNIDFFFRADDNFDEIQIAVRIDANKTYHMMADQIAIWQ